MSGNDTGEEYAAAVLRALETGEDVTPQLRKPRYDHKMRRHKQAYEGYARRTQELKDKKQTQRSVDELLMKQTAELAAELILLTHGYENAVVEWSISDHAPHRFNIKATYEDENMRLVRASKTDYSAHRVSKRFLEQIQVKKTSRRRTT